MQTGPKDEVHSTKAREKGLCVSLLERIHTTYSRLDDSSQLNKEHMASLLTNYRCHEGTVSCDHATYVYSNHCVYKIGNNFIYKPQNGYFLCESSASISCCDCFQLDSTICNLTMNVMIMANAGKC